MASKKKQPVEAKKKTVVAKKKKVVAAPSTDFSRPHPKLAAFKKQFKPGRHADGLLLFTRAGALDEELGPWLKNRMQGRVSLGRTAFGEFIVFRDLRARALENGEADAHLACDIAIVDIHTKQMKVAAHSVDEWVERIDDPKWQNQFFRKALHDKVKTRLGAYAADECYGFVPALELGGAEQPAFVARQKWREHQAILLQT